MLECGHPEACWNAEDEDDEHCAWCAETYTLRTQVKGLRDQLRKKAVVVTGGSPTIAGDIGYMEITGGTVGCARPGDDITGPVLEIGPPTNGGKP